MQWEGANWGSSREAKEVSSAMHSPVQRKYGTKTRMFRMGTLCTPWHIVKLVNHKELLCDLKHKIDSPGQISLAATRNLKYKVIN